MSATIGNRFWEIRSKHGRNTLFETPNLLWEAACEYFEWCEINPLIEIDFKGKDADRVEIPKMRVFTIWGLTSFLGCSESYFRNFKHQNSENHKDFMTVQDMIMETIRNQKYTGAAAGFLNAMIVARDLGLRDQVDTRNENYNLNIEPTPEEAQKIKESLDKSI